MSERHALLILLGPSGSGKSYLGGLLQTRGIARFAELEQELIARFGTGEAFAARKQEALQFLEDTHRAAIAAGGAPWALETTGVSEREMLMRLTASFATAFVRLDADRETCAARVASRKLGRNLDNSPDRTRQFHDFWTREIAPSYRFDLIVPADDAEAALAAIAGLLTT